MKGDLKFLLLRMNKKGSVGNKVVLALFIFFIIAHTGSHLMIFGSGTDLFLENGLDGLREIKGSYSSYENYSVWAVGGEWILLLLIVVVFVVRRIRKIKKVEVAPLIERESKISSSKTSTDLDVLYDKLIQKKKMKIEEIAKHFNISSDLAMEWAKILENANLARIYYPGMGRPEIKIIENGKE